MRLLPFLLVFLTLVGGLHTYIYLRLFWDPVWPLPVRIGGGVLLALLACSMPAQLILGRRLPRRVQRPLAYVVYVWMGAAFYFVVILFSLDVAQFLLGLFSIGWAPPQGARYTAAIATAATGGLTAAAIRSAADVEVREVEVKLDRLPPALSGLSLVQLSDVHVGPTIGKRFIDRIVERTNALSPDAIVITGDLVDGSVERLREHVEPIAKLSARYGVYFVTGNHDFYSGAAAWIAELERLGIRVLRNERVSIGDSASIDLAGVHDYGSSLSDPDRALGGRDVERATVLLAHQPRSVYAAAPHRPDLILAGHTHGGQLWPFNKAVRLQQPYVAGLYRHDEHTQLYVSRGTGYWGPPMRFLAPAEITKVVLT